MITTSFFFSLLATPFVLGFSDGDGVLPVPRNHSWTRNHTPPPPQQQQLNSRPIIGILSEPWQENDEYIVSSYVKFVEMAGARAVPLKYTDSDEKLKRMFSYINGLLLPGGGTDISPKTHSKYYNATRLLWSLAVDANNQNDHFPVWGTCLGWEEIAELASNDDGSVLEQSGHFNSENVSLPLSFQNPNNIRTVSRMFNQNLIPDKLYKKLQDPSSPIPFNSHSQGVLSSVFFRTPRLSSMFRLLATSRDLAGKEFVAAAEAFSYPFYAVQFHPEKSNFEWYHKLAINHSAEAIQFSQLLANLFISEARLNHHSFPNQSLETTSLIQNLHEQFFGDQSYFFQAYVFKKP